MKGTDYKSIVCVIPKEELVGLPANPSFGMTTKVLKDVVLRHVTHACMYNHRRRI